MNLSALYLLESMTYCKILLMIYIILIYVLAVIIFAVFTKIGFFHIRKNESIADVTSEDFITIFKRVSIAVIILTFAALIIEYIYLK